MIGNISHSTDTQVQDKKGKPQPKRPRKKKKKEQYVKIFKGNLKWILLQAHGYARNICTHTHVHINEK